MLTNTVNGKRYVGQTRCTLQHRWDRHLQAAQEGSRFPIHCAIRKYGQDVWRIEVLGTYETLQELDAAEQAAICTHSSAVRGKGYNLTLGGDRPDKQDGYS